MQGKLVKMCLTPYTVTKELLQNSIVVPLPGSTVVILLGTSYTV